MGPAELSSLGNSTETMYLAWYLKGSPWTIQRRNGSEKYLHTQENGLQNSLPESHNNRDSIDRRKRKAWPIFLEKTPLRDYFPVRILLASTAVETIQISQETYSGVLRLSKVGEETKGEDIIFR